MSDSLAVNIQELRELSRQLGIGAIGLEDELNYLHSQVQQLVALWTGDAQLAYVHAQQLWAVSIKEMKTLLASISAAAGEVADEYEASDGDVLSRFV